MAKGIRSFLPQLSIVVPAVTTGMLIFSEKVDPITSLLSSSGEEKKEDSSIEKTSKQKGDKDGEDTGKEGQKGKGETGDGKDKGGKSGEGSKDGSPDGKGTESKGQGAGDGGSGRTGDSDSKGDSPSDAKSPDGNSDTASLELNKLSGMQTGPEGQEPQDVNQAGKEGADLHGNKQDGHSDGDAQNPDGQEGSENNSGTVISGDADPSAERREVNGGSAGGETTYFAPAFSEILGMITSDDID